MIHSSRKTNKQTMQSKTELRMRKDKKAENTDIIVRNAQDNSKKGRSNRLCFFELFPCPPRRRAWHIYMT